MVKWGIYGIIIGIMFGFIKRHRVACGLVVLDVIIVLIVALAVVYNDAKTARIDINVAPTSALIEINGQKYDNFASVSVFPGDYHVVISMDGMQTKELDFSLDNDEFRKVEAYLLDQDGGFSYYVDNPDEEMVLAEVANDKPSKEFVEKYSHILSIVNDLPLEYYDRSEPSKPVGVYIEQSSGDCKGHVVCLVVYGGEGNREIALSLIREAGYDPNDYGISFSNGEEQ